MSAKYTIQDFRAQFPDEDSCLDWVMEWFYPHGVHCHKCDRVTKHHRVRTRKSYSCDVCGHHVHPTAGTIFHKSTTPLSLWLYAMYLMSSTRCGISAKQLERELGVAYKTAHRMFKLIRSILVEDTGPLSGTVEVDETNMGGKPRRYQHYPTKHYPKTIVIGAVERGGRLVTGIIYGSNRHHLMPFVRANVVPGSILMTDEHQGYFPAKKLYRHMTCVHSTFEFARGPAHTNTIEGFWGNFKTGMRGVYKHCAPLYLPNYLDEYTFRFNRRKSEVPMFLHFMAQTKKLDWWVPYEDRKSPEAPS